MGRNAGHDTLTRVPGVEVGHASDREGRSGVTVLLFERAAPAVVEVLGGASATYDTASLSLDSTFGRRWAVFFAGGSVFGLDAGRGVRGGVLERGRGHTVFQHPRRIAPVTGATLFDLPPDQSPLPDYAILGRDAAVGADRTPVAAGRVGAGTGATVGKYLGRGRASAGGLGSLAEELPGLGWVGALAVVNSVGAIRDPTTSTWLAGARESDGTIVPPDPRIPRRNDVAAGAAGTTLVVLVTEVRLDRPSLARVAAIAAGGVARAVVPTFTATDGDVLFAATTGEEGAEPRPDYPGSVADRVGALGANLVAEAIARAVRPGASSTRGR